MAITEISLNLLRAFDAAARQGSFTEAAKELFVTQAAVSHQIKALEAWLGKSLFHRTSRGLLLTDEGQLLAPTVGTRSRGSSRGSTACAAGFRAKC